jgi:glycerol-1-phosphate dehydrogenase [NAD(P)+]
MIFARKRAISQTMHQDQDNLNKRFADEHIHIGSGLASNAQELLKSHLGTKRALIVSDTSTHRVLAHRFDAYQQHVFECSPKADMDTAQALIKVGRSYEWLVAVGSGTINDLCKFAAHQLHIPYTVFATAPSMNGYVSANASLSESGYKKSYAATAPAAVFCDIELLSSAPQRLIQAGLGDLLCRSTVQADWLLSHLLCGTPYEARYFEWLKPTETLLLRQSAGLLRGDKQVVHALTLGLIVSGLAMRDQGNSAPASQSEHLIAHAVEMLYPTAPQPYHGEAIAVTTLTAARYQEARLNGSPQLNLVSNAQIEARLPPHIWLEAAAQYTRKINAVKTSEAQNRLQNWPALVNRIKADWLAPNVLQTALANAGCPTTPEQLGWGKNDYANAVAVAPLMRDRFTFLDLI